MGKKRWRRKTKIRSLFKITRRSWEKKIRIIKEKVRRSWIILHKRALKENKIRLKLKKLKWIKRSRECISSRYNWKLTKRVKKFWRRK